MPPPSGPNGWSGASNRPASASTSCATGARKARPGRGTPALDHLLRTCGDPGQSYVAILDDDDRWEPDHLRQCLEAAESGDLDMVAVGFHRIEEGAEPRPGRSAMVARRGELPCRKSRNSGQQPGLPAECAARSRPVRRIAAELHGSRSVHPHRGIAGRPLRRHLRADRSPLRLCIAARLSTPGARAKTEGWTDSSASTTTACPMPSARSSVLGPAGISDGRNRRPNPGTAAPCATAHRHRSRGLRRRHKRRLI